jgi:hypothetical protein
MLKRLLLVLVFIASLTLAVPTLVGAQTSEITKHAEQIKQEVAALPVGTRLLVKLRDKKKFTGHINYIGDEFFVITDVKTKASQKMTYADVAQITRKEDPGFPKKGKIALGILGVLFVMGMIANGGG